MKSDRWPRLLEFIRLKAIGMTKEREAEEGRVLSGRQLYDGLGIRLRFV